MPIDYHRLFLHVHMSQTMVIQALDLLTFCFVILLSLSLSFPPLCALSVSVTTFHIIPQSVNSNNNIPSLAPSRSMDSGPSHTYQYPNPYGKLLLLLSYHFLLESSANLAHPRHAHELTFCHSVSSVSRALCLTSQTTS